MVHRILFKRSFSSCLLAEIAAVVVFASLVAAGPAAGDCPRAVPVRVAVTLDLPALTKFWTADVKPQVEAELCKLVANQLAAAFPYWCFEPSSERSGLRIEFRLFNRNGEIALEETLWADNQVVGEPFSKVIWKPHQFGDIGKLAKQPLTQLEGIVRLALLTEEADQRQLRKLLMNNVPVATEGQWRVEAGAAATVVLPLPWEPNFKALQESDFRLQCLRRGHPTLSLTAKGSAEPGIYRIRDPGREAPFAALQVFPQATGGTKDLTHYSPGETYLERIVPVIESRLRSPRVLGVKP